MRKKDILWIKKTDHTLQVWPKGSSETNLSQSSKPDEVRRRGKGKIKVPAPLAADYLRQRGIVEAALTKHAAGFYQHRDGENFAFITVGIGGGATVEYGGRKRKIQNRDIMVAPQGSGFILKASREWRFLWLHLRSPQWRAALGGELRIIKNADLADDILRVALAYKSQVYANTRAPSTLNSLAEALAQLLKNGLSAPAQDPLEARLAEFFKRLAAAPGKHAAAKAIAKKFKTTPYNINKISRRIAGATFAKAQLKMRIDAAVNALQNGKNVRQAARIAGFADPYAFSKIFKRETKTPPSSLMPPAPRQKTRPQ